MPAIGDGNQRAWERNIRLFYLFNLAGGFFMMSAIWVIYLQDERGLSLGQVTAMEGPFWVAMVLLEVPTGVVADRWGRKLSLSLGMLLNAAAMFVFSVATSYPILFISYMAWAMALTFESGANAAFLYDTLKALGREADYQRIHGRAMAVLSGSMVVGTATGAALASVTSLAFPIMLNAGFMLAAFAVTLWFREPPRYHDEAEAHTGYLPSTMQAAKHVWRQLPIRYIVVIAAASGAAYGALDLMGQPFLREHGVAVGLFGLLYVPVRLAGVAGSLVAWRFSRGLGERRSLVAIPALMVACAFGFAAFDTVGAFVFLPVAGLAMAVGQTLYSAYINERSPSSQRATILSFQQLVMSLSMAALVPLAGALGDRAGLQAGYALIMALVGMTAAAGVLLWLRARRDGDAPATPDQTLAEPETVPAG